MEILMVSAEIAPFSGSSLAAKTVAGLSRALTVLGHRVTVLAPMYASFRDSGLMIARRLSPLVTAEGAEVFIGDTQLSSGVKLSLLQLPNIEAAEAALDDSVKESPELAVAYGALCQAAVALVAQRIEGENAFDVVHLLDYPTAAIASLLKASGFDIPAVFTLARPHRSGNFSSKDLGSFGLTKELFTAEGFKLGTKLNLLKGGILAADQSVVASEALAKELRGAGGGTLSEYFDNLERPLCAISPGIDYALFNPATDSSLAIRYDAAQPQSKKGCKAAVLRKYFEWDGLSERPLFVFRGELCKSSGADWLLASLPALLELDIDVIVQGNGAKTLEKSFASSRLTKRSNYHFIAESSEMLSRELCAAADFDLQLGTEDHDPRGAREAMRYGALPVVLAHHAASELIVDCDAELATGNGIIIHHASEEGLERAIQRSVAAFDLGTLDIVRSRVMKVDLSWEKCGHRYARLYRDIIDS